MASAASALRCRCVGTKTLACSGVGVLMEYVGDERAEAPLLIETQLGSSVEKVWQACLNDVEIMLANDLIHGDLSGYNILVWQDRPRLIDLPQAVDPFSVGNPFEMLHRDVSNLARPFQKAGLTLDPLTISVELAERYL